MSNESSAVMPVPQAEPAPGSDASELCRMARERMRHFDCDAYQEAAGAFRRAIDNDPGCAAAYAGLAEVYAYWGFRRELNGEEFESYYGQAHEYAEMALYLAPKESRSHRAMAVALRRGPKADPARRKAEAQAAVELDANDAEAWYEHWRAFGYDPSDAAIRKALDLDPGLFAAHHDLGIVLCEEGRLDEAMTHLLKALGISPRNSLAHYNLAMVLERKGLTEQAQAVLNRAAQMHPENPLIEEGLAILSGEVDA